MKRERAAGLDSIPVLTLEARTKAKSVQGFQVYVKQTVVSSSAVAVQLFN